MSRFTSAKETSQYLRFMVRQLPTVRCRARAGSSCKQHVHQHPQCTWHLCRLGPDSAPHLNSSHRCSSPRRSLGLCSPQLLPQVWSSITVHQVHYISAEERCNRASMRQGTVAQKVLETRCWCTSWEVATASGRQTISNDRGLKIHLWGPRGLGIKA